jgi:hypothetical protein
MLRRSEMQFRLIDIIPYLDSPWFTVLERTGETCNSIAVTYPERFLVTKISWDDQERKIVIVIREI